VNILLDRAENMICKCYSLIILIDLLFHIWITLMVHYWYLPSMYTFGIRVATLIHQLSLLCYYFVHQTVHMVCDIRKFLIRRFSFRLPRAVSETHIDNFSTTSNDSYVPWYSTDAQFCSGFPSFFAWRWIDRTLDTTCPDWGIAHAVRLPLWSTGRLVKAPIGDRFIKCSFSRTISDNFYYFTIPWKLNVLLCCVGLRTDPAILEN